MIYLEIIQTILILAILAKVYNLIPAVRTRSETPTKVIEATAKHNVIKCEFCEAELPWKAKRSKEGFWACDRCKAVRLNQIESHV